MVIAASIFAVATPAAGATNMLIVGAADATNMLTLGTPGATRVLTLGTPRSPLVAGQLVEATAFLRWNGPRGLYLCEGTLTGELSTNGGPADTVTLTQGFLPGANPGEGCLTGYLGEVQVTPANLPWSLTLERKGRGRLGGEKGVVVDWRLLDYREQCVFSRRAAVKVTYTTAKPVELIWPVTTLRGKAGDGSMCETEGKYSGELYLSSRGEPIEAVEDAVP